MLVTSRFMASHRSSPHGRCKVSVMEFLSPFRVTVKGIQIECHDITSVMQLVYTFGDNAEQQLPLDVPENGHTSERDRGSPVVSRDVGEHSATILKIIAAKKRTGVHTPDITRALNLKDPRAVGGHTFRLRLDLQALGFSPNRVYTTKRNGSSGRRWTMGNDIHRAVEAIEGANNQAGGGAL